ncbi:MAG: hypothetical protein AAF903_13335 [Pseudomonadota bacterium]
MLRPSDVSMGCAEGDFKPTEHFVEFERSVPPYWDNEVDHRIWNGFKLVLQNGKNVHSSGAVLHCIRIDQDNIEYLLSVLGIFDPPYEELFPSADEDLDD